MICAKEYMNIKAEAEIEEAFRQLKFEEEKKEWLAHIYSHTKEFCENVLNQMLIENAQNNKLETVLWCSDVENYVYHKTSCGFVYEDGWVYANGDKSFSVDDENTICIDFLKKYLAEHCFEIRTEPHNFMHYGGGEKKGYDIIITPQPSCE